MKNSRKLIALSSLTLSAGFGAASDIDDGPSLKVNRNKITAEYLQTVRETAMMVRNSQAQSLAHKLGLNILSLTWEDTGRYKNSSVGPNISDMTIQVGVEDPKTRQTSVTCMPVIRFPNFSDKTCDIDPRDFTLLVGNEKGRKLQRISLYDFIKEPTNYLTKPNSWLGKNRTLVADRDDKVLVSAQACFLPIPKSGKATFNPVLFNYQSMSGDPAVLTILATREGTSTTIIDNKRDAFSEGSAWGQRLFHNQNGMRASLTGQRFSDFGTASGGSGNQNDKDISGMNMVLLIQVPLKQKRPMRSGGYGGGGAPGAPTMEMSKAGRKGSDVENAVIGHGQLEGPYTEIDNLKIERDDRFPIRVTVQFYKATSNGVVNDDDLRLIKSDIDRVYEQSDSVGSLVTGGNTGRVTEYLGSKVQPAGWWNEFWHRHEENTGDTRQEAIAKLRKLLGVDYQARPVSDLYLRNLLRK
ncbi:MAG: hypothetical protein H7Y17_03045 [Chlorobia bacterium]|nr:hypothetical protein [Fimbriimonadaceae bacterium]